MLRPDKNTFSVLLSILLIILFYQLILKRYYGLKLQKHSECPA